MRSAPGRVIAQRTHDEPRLTVSSLAATSSSETDSLCYRSSSSCQTARCRPRRTTPPCSCHRSQVKWSECPTALHRYGDALGIAPQVLRLYGSRADRRPPPATWAPGAASACSCYSMAEYAYTTDANVPAILKRHHGYSIASTLVDGRP
jgi:hypothetical protein